MNDAPLIDDRRRFRELWKELVFARLLTPAACALAILMLGWTDRYAHRNALHSMAGFLAHLYWPLVMVMLVAPSVVAKRGKTAAMTVALLAAVGCGVAHCVFVTLVWPHWHFINWLLLIGVPIAAVGLAEGWLERSVATTCCGLLGGALVGGVVGKLLRLYSYGLAGVTNTVFFAAVVVGSITALHLGIGLSLALGRWIRDLPKRDENAEQPTQ